MDVRSVEDFEESAVGRKYDLPREGRSRGEQRHDEGEDDGGILYGQPESTANI